jgi:hypothetical protein
VRIGLLPLDERPVNLTLPGMVAAIAGARVVTPPRELLPRMRAAGDADGLARWLTEQAHDVDALVLSLDMLGYGGLIASRTSSDSLTDVVRRLATVGEVRAARPQLPISAVTTVMRASRSYSAAEEPAYWSEYGVELHRLGGALHQQFLGEPHDRSALEAAVPADVRRDFLARRLRNHAADLYALSLASTGVVSPLLVTADDTAPRSAGSLEQLWLDHWADALGLGEHVQSFPGADEVCSVLVARTLVGTLDRPPRIAVRVPEPGGEERVAPYENVPVGVTVRRQLRASGADVLDEADTADDTADAVLVLHAPDPHRGDWCGRRPTPAPETVEATVAAVMRELERGRVVGLADVRYTNGGDDTLVEALARAGVLGALAAYGGWNTAGNTIGSVAAALVSRIVATKRDTHDEFAEQRLLLHRLLEDVAYQAVVRTELAAHDVYRAHVSMPFDDPAVAETYRREVDRRLSDHLRALPGGAQWRLTGVRLPWGRTFEVDFSLER